ncbi:hypothetical protein VdG1_02203 [Verticillium dahliae VDG1]|nr:hypothetical protein VdG1_02203 [Verticillium dahliae VDG1]
MSQPAMMQPIKEEAQPAQHRDDFRDDAAEENQPYPGLFSQDTMPAIIESLVIDDVVSDDGKQTSPEQTGVSNEYRGHRRQRSSASSQSKIMTAQEFEMYRRAKMMHQHELDDESDYSQDDNDLDDVDERKTKQEAFQHRDRQQAYIAEQRYNRRKVSGGGGVGQPDTGARPESPAVADASVETWLSACSKRQSSSSDKTLADQVNAAAADQDDEDVPVALLLKARGAKRNEGHQKERSPQNTLRPPRPHTRTSSRQRATPSPPQPRAPTRSVTPSPGLAATGHHYGHTMHMNNSSQISLQRPSMPRPHTSGGLVSRIETLESPSPWNKRRTEPDPWLSAPLNPRRFYGRETTPPPQQYPVMMGNQFFPMQVAQPQYPVMMGGQFPPPQMQQQQQQYPMMMMGGQFMAPQYQQRPLY